jgi:hypothetical protein
MPLVVLGSGLQREEMGGMNRLITLVAVAAAEMRSVVLVPIPGGVRVLLQRQIPAREILLLLIPLGFRQLQSRR